MPDVIGADELRRFRKAGAGDDVIAFLSTTAAVDIGATAEGGAMVAGLEGPDGGGAYGGAYPDLVSSGYPFYGGGGYGGYGGWGGLGGRWGWGGMRHGFIKRGFGGRDGFFLGFGNGFGHFGRGFMPHPQLHPMHFARGGGTTHATITGGGGRRR